MIKLSICIPTYNRACELNKFFASLDKNYASYIELIVCDDGSTDETKEMVDRYSTIFDIKYIYQSNQGRSVALKNAVLNATCKYTILMDSDDYFLPNAFNDIFEGINQLESGVFPNKVCTLLFGTKLIKGSDYKINLPLNGVMNYVSVRADLKVKHDLKEVVLTKDIIEVMYEVPDGCRRVPTSILWARIAETKQCLSIEKAVAVKEYLSGGMSDKILFLKTKYSKPMTELYGLLAESNSYNSYSYRIRSCLLWSRHAWHTDDVRPKVVWQYIIWPIGYVAYLYDKIRLVLRK